MRLRKGGVWLMAVIAAGTLATLLLLLADAGSTARTAADRRTFRALPESAWGSAEPGAARASGSGGEHATPTGVRPAEAGRSSGEAGAAPAGRAPWPVQGWGDPVQGVVEALEEFEDIDGGLLERLATRDRTTRGLLPESAAPVSSSRPDGPGYLEGRVVDAEGRPVPAASVLLEILVESDAGSVLEESAILSGPNGSFHLTLPVGPASLRARLRECESPRYRTEVRDGTRLGGIELRLPMLLRDRVWLRGRVIDPEELPVALARVLDDQGLRAHTDERGEFEIEVDPGTLAEDEEGVLTIERAGFEPAEVAWRGPADLEVHLEWAQSGKLRVAGMVLDPDGAPVPGATLYLHEPAGTLRTVRTDARGEYAFVDLPDRLAEAGGEPWLNVWALGYFTETVEQLRVPSDPLVVRVSRQVGLTLRVVDADTGAELGRTGGELLRRARTPDGDLAWKAYRTWTGTAPGTQTSPAEPVRVSARADGYAEVSTEIDLTEAGDTHEVTLELRRVQGD